MTDHVQRAKALLEEGDGVMNFDHGHYATLSADERITRRQAAYTGAIAHAAIAAAEAIRALEEDQ